MPEETLGQRIKLIRKQQLGVGTVKLGQMLGVSAMAVSKWERDMNMPTHEHLKKLAKVTDVSLQWLITGESMVGKPESWERRKSQLVERRKRVRDLIAILDEDDELLEVVRVLVEYTLRNRPATGGNDHAS